MREDQNRDLGFWVVVVYDAFVHLEELRSSTIQIIFGILGLFVWRSFFSFMLFHVFTLSPDLANVAEAIRVPLKQLLLTFYIILASTFIYASFGFDWLYKNSFQYDDQVEMLVHFGDPDVTCGTLLECFTLFLYKGAPQGNVHDVIDEMNRTDPL